uniref:Uncharacterized protein n=1 Tax=Geospiza parvula TaxID=87175 RepID=A0A8U8BIN5_GEOPR
FPLVFPNSPVSPPFLPIFSQFPGFSPISPQFFPISQFLPHFSPVFPNFPVFPPFLPVFPNFPVSPPFLPSFSQFPSFSPISPQFFPISQFLPPSPGFPSSGFAFQPWLCSFPAVYLSLALSSLLLLGLSALALARVSSISSKLHQEKQEWNFSSWDSFRKSRNSQNSLKFLPSGYSQYPSTWGIPGSRNLGDFSSPWAVFPCGADSREWEYFSGNCYYFSLARLSWERARERCRERRADLVVVGSFAEQQFLMSRARNERFWIGLTDRNSEGNWEWVDGTDYKSSFTFWQEGEPNDSGNNEDCAHLWISGKWNDVHCTFECFFVCERPLAQKSPFSH